MKTPIWQRTTVAGLYKNTHSGVFYSRYSLNGKRTFRSLKTDVLTVAKLKHAKRNVDVEKDRQRGAGRIDKGDFKTLGPLLAEVKRRLHATPVAKNTAVGRANNIERLRKHWIRGSFDAFLARNVTADVIVELREHLLNDAEWKWNLQKSKPHRGFKVQSVNMALWVLRVMLDVAVEKMVLVENPFSVSTVLRATLRASNRKESSRREIPDRAVMLRIFAEMRRLPETSDRFKPNIEQRRWLALNAEEMAAHAELLAYSGMRKEEATRSTLADDMGTEFKIWGTKSETSNRTIPVNPALRSVLDWYQSHRVGARAKLTQFSEPRTAMRRACKRLNLPVLTNHALRHYFASVCIASGVDIPTVSRWLGHADGGALAMKTYGHLLRDASQKAAAKVDFTDQSRLVSGT